MAILSITFPDDKATEIREAFAVRYGWTPEMGITKTVFAKQMVAEYVKSIYQSYVIDKAAEAARATAKQTVSNIEIT